MKDRYERIKKGSRRVKNVPKDLPLTDLFRDLDVDELPPKEKQDFGRRKRKVSKKKGPSAALKKLCKSLKVKLTTKRGKKRVYKSDKVLKEQCKRASKRNFGCKPCGCGKFGKKVSKKPSAATRKMCKKLKVKLTVKRGKKRVYKSEKVLKAQCKKAAKAKSRKKRKSKFGG
jgi:hypothetical protein